MLTRWRHISTNIDGDAFSPSGSLALADDGLEALQIYKEALQSDQPIDLVLLDLTIPGGVGGKDAMEQLLALDNKAQVIVSSGYSNDPIMANYTDYGFCAAIAKPYQLSDLAQTISQLIC